MTKKITSNRSSTLVSLLNTLERFLGWLKARNECWLTKRTETIALRREYKRDRNPYNRELDYFTERVTFNDGLVVVETLVGRLIVTLEGNPFPGEKKRVLQIALELFPEAEVMLQPGVFYKGEKLWLIVFEIGEIDHRERLRFPVKEGDIEVTEMEKLLYENVRKDGTILAMKVASVLNLETNSKVYRSVKSKLEERGWVWSARRESGKMTRIVIAPGETASGP
jgi:hypothetical protein